MGKKAPGTSQNRYFFCRLNMFLAKISREQQAKNMAIEILKHGNKIQFSSDSYKPDVEYVDGSYSLLVQHYIKEHGGWIVKENPSVFVRVHETDNVPENVVVFDPWRTYKGPNLCIRYGDTR